MPQKMKPFTTGQIVRGAVVGGIEAARRALKNKPTRAKKATKRRLKRAGVE